VHGARRRAEEEIVPVVAVGVALHLRSAKGSGGRRERERVTSQEGKGMRGFEEREEGNGRAGAAMVIDWWP
jgi:hypothetical protein